MEIINAQSIIEPGRYDMIDKRIVTLENISAEIGARLTRVAIKQFRSREAAHDESIFECRTLIPMKSM